MRLLRIIVNLLYFLSAPVWCGFFLQFVILKEIYDNVGTTREAMAGKNWIWDIK